jgi:hypothetical protein
MTRTVKEAIATAKRPAMGRRSVYAPLRQLEALDKLARKEGTTVNRLLIAAIDLILTTGRK